ncbi:MAG: DUF2232 domain-containing protein [Spirochaetota bacterium]
MIILISLIIGIFVLVGTARICYKFPWKFNYLFFLLPVLFALAIFPGNDFFNSIISFIIIGAAAGYTFKNNKNLRFFIFVTSLSITFIFAFNHYYLKNVKNIDILQENKNKFADILKESNVTESEKKQMIQKIDETLYIVKDMMPFAYFLSAFILSIAGFYIMKFLFIYWKFNRPDNAEKKLKGEENNKNIFFDGIEKFKVIDYLIFIYIAAWFIVLLVDKMNYYFLYIAGLNIALILACFYLIQAFGILKFFLKKKGLPSSLMLLIVFSLLVFGMEYMMFSLIILSSIGAIDFWADFRKLDMDVKQSNL